MATNPVNLKFAGAQLHQPATLVFGDDGSNPIKDAVISGALSFPLPPFTSLVAIAVKITGALSFPLPAFASTVVYVSDAQRPLVNAVVARWQDATPIEAGAEVRMQPAITQQAGWESHYRAGVPLQQGASEHWRDSLRADNEESTRFQYGITAQRSTEGRFQEGLRAFLERTSRYQNGIRVSKGVSSRYQDGTPQWRDADSRFQDGLRAVRSHEELENYGLFVETGRTTRYQDAIRPSPGRRTLPQPPLPDPCYVPNSNLEFVAPWSSSTHLLFACERHGAEPVTPPDPTETVVVPIRRIYTVINSASLYRIDGHVFIPTRSMSLTIDADSWTWGFTASVPGIALPDLEPGGDGAPVEVEAMVNGVAYRAIVEGIQRERTFGRSDLTITGRGKAAVLDAPYSPATQSFGNADERTAQQLANDVLTINGASLGWDVDWEPEDWSVGAGAFAHQGSYITALNAIASAAGAYVQAHRSEERIAFLLRYPAMPWEWNDMTPDYELPSALMQKESIQWSDKPVYNRVYVSGEQQGVLGQVTRAGTAGDLLAPMVVDQLIATAAAARQRGLPVLADVGRQALVGLRMPVLPETGIIPPGKFVRYVDGSTTRIGLVRTTAATTERSDDKKLTVWQTIGVETHVNV
ncbi:hypothetical protein BH11PSE13_BH11PSE13_12080 [soil metagenome]